MDKSRRVVQISSPSPYEMNRDISVQKQQEIHGSLFSFLYNIFPCLDIKSSSTQEEVISDSSHSTSVWNNNQEEEDNRNDKAVIFTMAELNKATSNFSQNCKIGQGGFGTVYKGILRDGRTVAIKRARKDAIQGSLAEQFKNEVNLLAHIEHLNLVKLIGFLEEGNERILVEEYVSNGNLRQHLDREFDVVLDIFQRLDIAIDVAHAITYLHIYSDKSIIHRDVKSTNILLTEHLRAKVADFGFSRSGPTEREGSHVMTKVKGTAGYLDPEYLKTYKLTTKSDVFAFGVLLVEIFTGRRPIETFKAIDERITIRWAYDKYRNGCLEDALDPFLDKTQVTPEVLERIFKLAFQCAAPTRQDRPDMKEAAEKLWVIRKDYRPLLQNGERQSR